MPQAARTTTRLTVLAKQCSQLALGHWSGMHAENSGTSIGRTQDVGNHSHTKSGGVSANTAANAGSCAREPSALYAINFIIRAL